MYHYPSEPASVSAAAASTFRVMSADRSGDEQTVRRRSSYESSPCYNDQQQQQQQQRHHVQPHKRRRLCCSIDSPPRADSIGSAVTRSTSWNEFSASVPESSSSSFPRHHHAYRPLLSSFPYRMAAAGAAAAAAVTSSLLIPPWSVPLPPVTLAAVGQVTGCFGAAVQPSAYATTPGQRADTHPSPRTAVDVYRGIEAERLHQYQRQRYQQLSMSGTDKLSSFTGVVQTCTRHRSIFSSGSIAGRGGGKGQLDEGNSSLISYDSNMLERRNQFTKPNQQEAQLMLTNPRDALRGQSMSPNIVPFDMLGIVSY